MAVNMVVNSGSTSRSIISSLGPEIFVQMSRILTEFCPWKLGVPLTMTHRVCVPIIVRNYSMQYTTEQFW